MDVTNFDINRIDANIGEIVDAAIIGIIKEGEQLGKQREAQWMCDQLEKVKSKCPKDIGDRCVNLYTRESFLYKMLNTTMRLCGDKEQEHMWTSKAETLGPFALLLFNHVTTMAKRSEKVYRGVNLKQEDIEEYRILADHNGWESRSFQSFISCTRNLTIAQLFGNTIFEINLSRTYRAMDVSSISSIPDEEELLLPAGIPFGVESVVFDPTSGKTMVKIWIPFYDSQDD